MLINSLTELILHVNMMVNNDSYRQQPLRSTSDEDKKLKISWQSSTNFF